jgi:DNA-binding NtrC family response regulator
MPLDLQDRLQRMLERQVQTTSPWVLTSNDKPLQSHLAGSRLNKTLIDRLNTIHIHIPPLRQTPEQIPQILAWYLNHKNNDPAHGLPLMPDASTMKRLMDYHWPGNLHQLRQISHRVIEQQGWDTVINSLETLSVPNAEIIDEMVAIFILSLSKISVCKERILDSLIAAADINDVGLLDLAIFHEVAIHFTDMISMPNRKDYPHEE